MELKLGQSRQDIYIYLEYEILLNNLKAALDWITLGMMWKEVKMYIVNKIVNYRQNRMKLD
jgi:hypothetical protein